MLKDLTISLTLLFQIVWSHPGKNIMINLVYWLNKIILNGIKFVNTANLIVCPLPDFLIPVLELVFVSLSLLWLLLEGSFCRDSSREALEVFWIWVILVSAKIGTVSLVISTVIWCDINLASFVTGLQELYSVVKIITK